MPSGSLSRACGTAGCTGWSRWLLETLNVGTNTPPSATMQWWSPCFEIASACAPGSPDGLPGNFTLNADYSDSDSGPGSQIVSVEWDFDADGNADQTDTFGPITSGSGSRSTAHSYAEGAYQPQVRFCDNAGCGGWDKKDIAFIPVDLDSDGPAISVNNPNPCFPIHPTCTAGSPDATTADVVAMSADYNDAFGVAVASVEWDFDGNGTVDDTTSVSGTTGTATTTHQYGTGGACQIKARAIGNDGVIGQWNQWKILGLPNDYDVGSTQVRAQMGCPTPHSTVLGIDCAGAPDVRVGAAVTLNADVDTCATLCVGNYFTPTDINGCDIEWDLSDGSAHVIEAIGGGADRTRAFPSGYTVSGAYKPLVRLCDDAASSTNCSAWDACDIALVEDLYKYDVDGPSATVDNPNPCEGIYSACVNTGLPDASTSDVVTMNMSCNDAFGVDVASVEWDFDGNGTVDDTTTGLSGTSGTASTTHQYGSAGAYTIKARAIGNDGAIGQWNQWKILGLPNDYDVGSLQIQATMACWDPHDATVFICGAGPKDVRANYAVKLNADIDTCSLGVLCVGNYFTPTDQNDYDIEWRLGDASPSVIDSIGGATTPRSHNFPAGYPATGQYRPEVRLCDDAASSTNCSAWDRYDVTLVEQDLEVWAPCTGDADLDGVPCYFDPDSDTASYNHQLNYVKQAMIPGIILTNAQPDAALIALLNLNRTLFFGAPIYWGGMNFINADIINPGGSYVNLKWSHFGMWANVGIGSSPDTGYVRGLSFCMGAKPGSLFGFAFGFCTYQASFEDDQQPLEVEDEVLFSSYINGYGATDYEGFTLPLVSPEIQVSVNP